MAFPKKTIFDDVLDFIRRPASAPEFTSLALRVVTYQLEHVPAYRSYVESLGVDLATVPCLEQVPAVSTLAFKYARMESVAEPPTSAARRFLTSGTTIGREERGSHLVLCPEIYRASAIGHLRSMLFPDPQRLAMLALHPTTERMPESSLSQMISWCIEEFGTAVSCCAATPEAVDVRAALDFLQSCIRHNRPVAILATTAACAKLFVAIDESRAPIVLPAGSRLMDTGGAKGQTVPLTAADIIEQAERCLRLEPDLVINEYGMTEMCSQLYDATPFNSKRRDPPASRVKLAPPWLRPFALDPATLRPLSDGAPGLLAFFDLANVASVSMLLTEDLGVIDNGAVTILGRAATADTRGCALAITEFASSP
jgi:hypothetical protein